MKINEFAEPVDSDSLPFDVVDDLAIYMRNDPIFYRKEFFPLILKIKKLYDTNKAIDSAQMFSPMINKAMHSYCRKFNIPKHPEELLGDEERDTLIQKLHSEELTNIRNGEY
jgi:hypothetical protein